jgi:GH15 family glucan-1,4-alpha-glucosidase
VIPVPSKGHEEAMSDQTPKIGDYAIIGDCRSAALISRGGSLDWLCWPRFDSPAVFAAILDADRGGKWTISPSADFRSTRRYVPGSNVLETRFEMDTGVVLLHDFMPVDDDSYRRAHMLPDHAVFRLLRCESGSGEIAVHLAPRPNFARRKGTLINRGKLGLRLSNGHGMLALHAKIPFTIKDDVATATLSLSSGDEIPLVMTYAESSPEVMPLLDDARASLDRTISWWTSWSASNRYQGPYREAVLRSVLTLKLLAFPASGAFVAAPTTSLPERIGGKLNWDYRYCWLRDASFTMEGLCETGFEPEAQAFADWMLHATRRTQPKLKVMYDLHGNSGPRERKVNGLAGFRGSSPVQVGNGARSQTQLDTYGEVVAGVAKLHVHQNQPAGREASKVLVGFGNYVCKHWREPDSGIWEPRGKPVVHTHSRLMCWVALDVLLDLHRRRLVRDVPVDRFERARRDIRDSIESDSWDASASSYTNELGKLKLDATLLRIAIHGFEPAASQRMRQTHENAYRHLCAGGDLLYRNLPDDGVPDQGAFGICGFWRVQFLAMGGGSLEQAESAFEMLWKTANDLGLFSEETDPATADLLGNFPQAFTHVGLINAALAIERRRATGSADR